MASTKASRKGNGSDNGSKTIKTRKAHESKAAITKSAVKKSNAKAKKTREYVMKKKDKPIAQNGRQPGRQLIRWNGRLKLSLLHVYITHKTLSRRICFEPSNSSILEGSRSDSQKHVPINNFARNLYIMAWFPQTPNQASLFRC